MGYFRSEKEAAYFALKELQAYLPTVADNNGREWGTIIYRFDDPKGGYWYSYQSLYKGDSAEWEPRGIVPKGAEERAFCHTHPNDAPFSKQDIDTASGETHVYPRCTMYMVTQSGAYWYDGRIEAKLFPRNAPVRYGTMWGIPYSEFAKK